MPPRHALVGGFTSKADTAGALHEPDGVGVHPLKLAFGYIRKARALGVRIHPASPVTGWETVNGLHHLRTPGGVVRARALAKRLDTPLAIVDKRRERAGESEVMNIIGDVEGRSCILIDDIVDSGGTLCNAAAALRQEGAVEVVAYCTHGVLSGAAAARRRPRSAASGPRRSGSR